MTVVLTYFRESGKYYCSGSFEVPDGASPDTVWNLVRDIWKAKELPGLTSYSPKHILVKMPSRAGYGVYEQRIISSDSLPASAGQRGI